MKRIISCLLVLVLCLTCLVYPVSATNFESGVENSNQCFDLLDYSTLNDSGKNYIGSPAGGITFTYSNPFPGDLAYVDMLINFSGGVNPGHIYASRGSEFTQYDLTLVKVSGNLWRAYGYINDYIDNLHITLCNSQTSFITVFSIKVFPVYNLKPVSTDCNVYFSTGVGNYSYSTSGGFVEFDLPELGVSIDSSFICTLSFSDFRKFDFIDFVVTGYIKSFDSIEVHLSDGTLIPFSATPLTDTSFNSDAYQLLSISLDLSSINKSLVTGDLKVIISGIFDGTYSYPFSIRFCRGYVKINDLNPLLAFWYNLKSFLSTNFNTLFSKLDEIFGLNDNAVSNAQQTQEEINVSVNNQLVGAVEDWNTHIEVVEAGYDMAFSKTTPGLTWLASLADGIFNGMGWFGNVYFLIGLISVIMLVLSKSGLARSVGRIRRND